MAKAVLITEENETNAVAVLNALNKAHAGNHIQGAENSALVPLREHAAPITREGVALPEILLLDLKKPRSEGFPVMDWVRAQSHLKKTWVVVVSGADGLKEVQLGYGLGALLIKPCSDYEIQKMMQWIADSSESDAGGSPRGPI